MKTNMGAEQGIDVAADRRHDRETDPAARDEVEGYRLNAMDPREPSGPSPMGSPATVGGVVAALGVAGPATPYVANAIDAAIDRVIANPYVLLRPFLRP
jgi:hypothetical protein